MNSNNIQQSAAQPAQLKVYSPNFGKNRDRSLQERFEEFHRSHPEVYSELVRFARQVKAKGYKQYSIYTCIQRVRWHFSFERDATETFKVNDHCAPRYARLIMEREPDLKDFFTTRKLRAD